MSSLDCFSDFSDCFVPLSWFTLRAYVTTPCATSCALRIAKKKGGAFRALASQERSASATVTAKFRRTWKLGHMHTFIAAQAPNVAAMLLMKSVFAFVDVRNTQTHAQVLSASRQLTRTWKTEL